MTSASSLAFPTMEVPAVEDSMEMASPYQGHNDDFDIDLDIMEDQVSNMDSDMMGADDYLTSQPSLFNNDAINDADMVDEPSEGSMVDADDVVDEDHDIEVQDEEVTYEAEMQEGDQPVTVDAPVLPTIQVEVPTNIEDQTVQPIQNAPEPVAQPVNQEGFGDPPEITPLEMKSQEPDIKDSEPTATEKVQTEEPQHQDVEQKAEIVEETNEAAESNVPTAEENLSHSEPAPVESLEAPPAQPSSAEANHENGEQSETHDPPQNQGQGAHDDESLHPVKVLYQGNEISLFPPLEGDSAETFFLHDEDVAYDNVDKLFSSLREILLDNVAEHEVLVIDIDSLGIQITEDSSHTSNMTLHQILNVYLRLCHNDGNDEPEALYLTLTTKPACHSELAALDAAANEGKGLSQIHEWDDYDEAGPAEDEVANAEETARSSENSKANESRRDQTVHVLDEVTQDNAPFDEGSHHEADETNDAEEEHAEPRHENVPGDYEAEPETVVGDHEDAQEVKEDIHVEEAAGRDNEEEGHYDSEAQNTDSSATVASASHPTEQNEQAEDGDAGATETFDLGNQDEEGADAEDLGHEDASRQTETYNIGEPEDFQDAHPGEHATEETADHADENLNDLNAAPEDEDSLADDIDDGSYEQSESTLEPAPREGVATHERTPEPEDDLLGIAEDLMHTPANNRQNGQLEPTESFEQEQHPEDDLATPPPPPVDEDGAEEDDADNQQSGDGDGDNDFDDYYPPPDLEVTEVTEAIELGEEDSALTDSHALDNVSTKRSREEEDEWDISETTTPEIKRRRS